MYPSRLEAQLVFILLGPLAIAAALTQFAALHPHLSFVSTASAVRNVCNATLTILFSLSLAFWGFVVNRKQAWRTDGGTAAFGAGAIFLSLVSTALTIAYIPSQDQFEWIPGLTGAIVLWQTFLGWWWWVGAGMGINEVEEWLQRAEKRRRRRIAREAYRKERKDRFRGAWNALTGGGRATSVSSTALEKMPPGLTTAARVNTRGSDSDSVAPSSKSDDTSIREQQSDCENVKGVWYSPWSLARRTYHYIRNAHISAARSRAIERAEHIREVFDVNSSPADVPVTSGWGLGSFAVREREAAEAAYEMESVEGLVRLGQNGAGAQREVEAEEDEEREALSEHGARPRRQEREYPPRQPGPDRTPAETTYSSSLWWLGPLRRWRLQDATEYSGRS